MRGLKLMPLGKVEGVMVKRMGEGVGVMEWKEISMVAGVDK